MIPRSGAQDQEVNSRRADEVFAEHGAPPRLSARCVAQPSAKSLRPAHRVRSFRVVPQIPGSDPNRARRIPHRRPVTRRSQVKDIDPTMRDQQVPNNPRRWSFHGGRDVPSSSGSQIRSHGRVARAVARPGSLRSEQGDFHHSALPLRSLTVPETPLGPLSGQNTVARLTSASWILLKRQVTEAPSPTAGANRPLRSTP